MTNWRYLCEFWIRPILCDIDPNSRTGLAIRIRKLREDGRREKQAR